MESLSGPGESRKRTMKMTKRKKNRWGSGPKFGIVFLDEARDIIIIN